LTAVIVVITAINVTFFVIQVSDQDRQVGEIKNAINNGITTAKRSIESVLEENARTTKTVLDSSNESLKKSLDTMHNDAQTRLNASIEQGKAVLDASIAASRLDQRAWIGPVTHIEPSFAENNRRIFVQVGSNSTFGVDVINTGKTPAINVASRLLVGIRSARESFECPQLATISGSLATVLPNQKLRMSVIYPAVEGGMSRKMFDGIKSGLLIVYIYGRIDYSDVFKAAHTTTFCMMMDRDMESINSCSMCNSVN
jgi:hypothetical protein